MNIVFTVLHFSAGLNDVELNTRSQGHKETSVSAQITLQELHSVMLCWF